MKFSSVRKNIFCRYLNPLFQNQHVHLLLLPSLFKSTSQSPGQNQQNGKQTKCQILPYSFRNNLKKITFHISTDPLLLFFSLSNCFFNFLSNLCMQPWFGNFFKFVVSRILENVFESQKIESRHFYLCPQVLDITPQGEGN